MPEDQLRALLVGAGYKRTTPRGHILALIARRRGVFSAAELLEALGERAPDVGRATLFRTLDILIGLGALERVRLPAGQEAYLLCDAHHHHHVVCSSCGAIGEVVSGALERTLTAAVEDSGFILHSHALELSGVCAPCATDASPRPVRIASFVEGA